MWKSHGFDSVSSLEPGKDPWNMAMHRLPTCLTQRKEKKRRKLLVCHDFKGGYGQDSVVQGVSTGSFNVAFKVQDFFDNVYPFVHWALVDCFVYFSHRCITIPPVTWINAAHKNGTKILGTFITEWEPGFSIHFALSR
jgi:mannosyl-glycoprotein endo-beta-N-acetylglucosaminidase